MKNNDYDVELDSSVMLADALLMAVEHGQTDCVVLVDEYLDYVVLCDGFSIGDENVNSPVLLKVIEFPFEQDLTDREFVVWIFQIASMLIDAALDYDEFDEAA